MTLTFARSRGIVLPPEDAGGILPLLGELEVHDDVPPGLDGLKELGFQLVPHTQLSQRILAASMVSTTDSVRREAV